MTCHECQGQWILSEGEVGVPQEVRVHIAACAHCQNFVRDSGQLRAHLRSLAESEAAPELLRRHAERAVGRAAGKGSKPQRRGRGAAAAIVLLALGGYGVHHYWQRHSRTPRWLANEFINDHLHYLPGREQIVSDSGREIEDWFRGRVDFPVRAPAVAGAVLEDARVCDIAGRKAALLHYRLQPGDAMVSLFIAEEPDAPEGRHMPVVFSVSTHGVNSRLWSQRGLVYDLVGALDDASLQRMAETVRKQEP